MTKSSTAIVWIYSLDNLEYPITIRPDGTGECFDQEAAYRARKLTPLALVQNGPGKATALQRIEAERQEFSVGLKLPGLIIERIRKSVANQSSISPEEESIIDELLTPYFKDQVWPYLTRTTSTFGNSP